MRNHCFWIKKKKCSASEECFCFASIRPPLPHLFQHHPFPSTSHFYRSSCLVAMATAARSPLPIRRLCASEGSVARWMFEGPRPTPPSPVCALCNYLLPTSKYIQRISMYLRKLLQVGFGEDGCRLGFLRPGGIGGSRFPARALASRSSRVPIPCDF